MNIQKNLKSTLIVLYNDLLADFEFDDIIFDDDE